MASGILNIWARLPYQLIFTRSHHKAPRKPVNIVLVISCWELAVKFREQSLKAFSSFYVDDSARRAPRRAVKCVLPMWKYLKSPIRETGPLSQIKAMPGEVTIWGTRPSHYGVKTKSAFIQPFTLSSPPKWTPRAKRELPSFLILRDSLILFFKFYKRHTTGPPTRVSNCHNKALDRFKNKEAPSVLMIMRLFSEWGNLTPQRLAGGTARNLIHPFRGFLSRDSAAAAFLILRSIFFCLKKAF